MCSRYTNRTWSLYPLSGCYMFARRGSLDPSTRSATKNIFPLFYLFIIFRLQIVAPLGRNKQHNNKKFMLIIQNNYSKYFFHCIFVLSHKVSRKITFKVVSECFGLTYFSSYMLRARFTTFSNSPSLFRNLVTISSLKVII